MEARVLFFLAALGIVQSKLINSCSETKIFVNGHNDRRLKLAKGEIHGHPAASKMTYLVWDEELAAKASKWASKNKYGHNPDKTIRQIESSGFACKVFDHTGPHHRLTSDELTKTSGRFNVGENIYWYGTSDKNFNFDPEMAMDYWWDEHKDFIYHELSMKDFSGLNQIGHYTQMAWADTIRLGCGISQYDENGWNNFFVVCNYGPAGNFLGQAPYGRGDEASSGLVCGESDCSRKYGEAC